MQDVVRKWLPVALAVAAVALLPFAQEAGAVPTKGANCYVAQCHTLGAGAAAPVGKGVQNDLWLAITDPATGVFERDSATLAPHTLGASQWQDEGRCVGCHTDKQADFDEVPSTPMSWHPVYNVIANAADGNHVRCLDCHTMGNLLNDNYHIADASDWLAGTFSCADCHDGSVPVPVQVNITAPPILAHGTTRYDTVTYSTCYGATGCHDGHINMTADNLVNIANYATAETTAGVCITCHPAQNGDAVAVANKHDLLNATYAECDLCHDFSTHTGGTVYVNNFAGGNLNAATSLDAFCTICHDGGYPTAGTPPFSGWQAGGQTGGGAGNVKIDGDASTYGYEYTGHGLGTGSTFSPAAWKLAAGAGNPSPPDVVPAGAWVGGVNPFTNTVSCNACHDSHWSTRPYMIEATIQGNAVSDGVTACTACHNSTLGIDATSQFAGLDTADYTASAHDTAGNLSCYGDADGGHTESGCHDPHGTAGTYKAMMIPGNEEEGCTANAGCHGASAAGSGFNKSASSGGEFTLASSHGVTLNGTGGEIECTNCHNPHLVTLADPVISPDAVTTVAADAASPGAPVPNFDRFTDFCMACHDGTMPTGVSGAATAQNHWAPGSTYAPSEDPAFTTQCWHCHDSHGSQNVKLVGNTRNTVPGSNAGITPTLIGNRAVYNVYDTAWAPAAAGTNDLVYNGTANLDPSAPGNNDGSTVTDNGLCDRCHNSTHNVPASDNATHSDAFGQNCLTCHPHNGTVAGYATAFPMLPVGDCFLCHGSAAAANFRTQGQFLAAHGGNMAGGSDHNITYTVGTQVDCTKCHLLSDATYPHKNGTVVTLQACGGATLHSDSGDYKLRDADVTLAQEVAFCLACHGGTPPNDAAGNLTGYNSGNTPVVSASTAGTYYLGWAHGAGVSIGNGAAAPAVGCTDCHQYHGGTIAQTGGFPQTLVATANLFMVETLDTQAYLATAADKDDYCAETCHSKSVIINNNSAYANGVSVIDHTWGEPGDADGKTQSDCPQGGGPAWDDCETHPSNRVITLGAHYQYPPGLPITGGTTLTCATCHDPHGLVDPDAGKALGAKQMLRLQWDGAGTLCAQCHK